MYRVIARSRGFLHDLSTTRWQAVVERGCRRGAHAWEVPSREPRRDQFPLVQNAPSHGGRAEVHPAHTLLLPNGM